MKNFRKKLTSLLLSLAILGTTFVASYATTNATPEDPYKHDDISFVVEESYDKDANTVKLKVKVSAKDEEKFRVDGLIFPETTNEKRDLQYPDKTKYLLPDPEEVTVDHEYEYEVSENGEYDFTVKYSELFEVAAQDTTKNADESTEVDPASQEQKEEVETPSEEADAVETKTIGNERTATFTVKVEDKIKNNEEGQKDPVNPSEEKEDDSDLDSDIVEPSVGDDGDTTRDTDIIVDGFKVSPKTTTPTIFNVNDNNYQNIVFSIELIDKTSTVVDGKIEFDVASANMSVDRTRLEKNTSTINTSIYDAQNGKVIVYLRDGAAGSFDYSLPVRAMKSAISGTETTVDVKTSGKNGLGHIYQEVTTKSQTLKIEGTNSYVQVTPTNYTTMAPNTNFKNTFAVGYNTINFHTLNILNNSSKGGLVFDDLIIKRINNGVDPLLFFKNYPGGTFGVNNGQSDNETGTVSVSNSTASIIHFGEFSGNVLTLRDYPWIKESVTPGAYPFKYEIYNGDDLIFTVDRTLTITGGQTTSSINTLISHSTSGPNDEFNYSFNHSVISNPTQATDITFQVGFPTTIKPTFISNSYEPSDPGKTDNYKYFYRVEGSETWTRITSPSMINSISNVNGLRTEVRNSSSTDGWGYTGVRFKNIGLTDPSNNATITVEEAKYKDFAGVERENKVFSDGTNSMLKRTITGQSTTVNPGVSEIIIAGGSGNNTGGYTWPNQANEYTTVTTYKTVRLFSQGGQKTEVPYTYAIHPKDVKVEPYTVIGSHGYGGTEVGYATRYTSNGDLGAPMLTQGRFRYPDQSKVTSDIEYKTVSYDGENDITYIIFHNVGLQGSPDNPQYAHTRYLITTPNTNSGVKSFTFGAGFMSDNAFKNTKPGYNGFNQSTTPQRVKDIIGTTSDREFTITNKFTIESKNNVPIYSAVKGASDDEFINIELGSERAKTMPGSTVNYRYTFSNEGTDAITDFEAIDILPYVGDELITGASRGSQYQINSTGKVKVLINGEESEDYFLQYSIDTKPQRFDQNGNDVSGKTWSNTVSDMTNVRALRLKLDGVKLNPGDKIELSFEGILPVDSPRNGEVAFNSVGVRGKLPNGSMWTDESLITGVNAEEPQNVGELSGRIYQDINKNGSYDSEPGLNGVTVQLYSNADVLLETKTTAPNTAGDAGYYTFNNLSNGVYKIKVIKPENGIFITSGSGATGPNILVNSADGNAWIQQNSLMEFAVTDHTKPKFTGLDGAIIEYSSVTGKIEFLKNDLTTVGDKKYTRGFTVEVYDGNTKIGTETSDPDGNFNVSELVLSQKKNYTVKVKMPSGKLANLKFVDTTNNGDYSIELDLNEILDLGTVQVTDKDNPVISTIVPHKGGTANVDTNPDKFEYTVSDATTDITHRWVIKDPAGVAVPGATGTDKSTIGASLASIIAGNKSGTYKLEITATDAAGNTATKSSDFKIIATQNKPVLTSKTNPEKVIEVSHTRTNPTKAQAITEFELVAKDALGTTLGETSYTMTDLDKVNSTVVGTYPVKVTAKDSQGNISNEITVTYKVVDTTKPTLTIPNKEVTLNRSAKNTAPVTAAEVAALLGTPVFKDNNPASTSVMKLETSFNFGSMNLKQDGTYTIQYFTTDAVGLKSDVTADSTVKVNVKVYDDIDTVNQWGIKAKPSFITTVDKVDTEAKIISEAGVEIFKLSDGSKVTTATIEATPKKLAEGKTTVNFKVTSPTSTLTAKSDATIYTVIKDGYGLTVNNFVASVDNVQDAAGINAQSGVQVYKISDNSNVTNQMTITHKLGGNVVTSLPVGENQQVTFEVNGLGVTDLSKTVTARIYDNYNPGTDRGLIASDFVEEIGNVTDPAKIRTASGAKVFVASTGVVDTGATNAIYFQESGSTINKLTYGMHNLKVFGGGITTDITALVVDDIVDGIAMIAKEDITISTSEANDSDRLVIVAGAQAWKVNADKSVTPIDRSDIFVKPADLPVANGGTINFTTTFGGSTPSVVTVEDTQVSLNYNSQLIVTLEEVQTKSATDLEALLIERAGATASRNSEAVPIKVLGNTVNELKALKQTRELPYSMTLEAKHAASGDKKESSPIKVYVVDAYDPVAQVAISATNFALELDRVGDINIKTAANAKAWDLSFFPQFDLDPIHGNVRVTAGNEKTVGIRDVTFTVKGRAGIDKSVTVEGLIANTVDQTKKEAVIASDFTIDLANANETNMKIKADAKAYDFSNITDKTTPFAPISVESDPKTLTTVGVQNVQFKTVGGTGANVKATVKTDGDNKNNREIYANNFVIEKDNVEGADIKQLAGVELFDTSITPNIKITDLTDVTVTGELDKLGKNEITFTHTPSGATIKVDGYVVDTIEGGIAFEGHNFSSSIEGSNTKAKIIGNAEFKAYDIRDISNIERIDDVNTLVTGDPDTTTSGDKVIKFTTKTADGTLVKEYTVNATLFKNGGSDANYAVYANNFAITLDEVTTTNFVTKSGARATKDGVTMPDGSVEVEGATPTTVGEHTVTLRVVGHEDAKTTITVIIANKIENGEAIFANDFTIDVDNATEANMKIAADAKAFDISDLDNIQPISVESTPKVLTELGDNAVNFKTAKGTDVDVVANVKGKGDAVGDFVIYANNFVTTSKSDDLKTAAGVELFKTDVIPNVKVDDLDDVTVTGSLANKGPNTITFTHTPSGAKVIVTGYLVDAMDGDVAFKGHNYTSKLNDSDTKGKVIGLSEFEAYDISDLTDIQPIAEENVTVEPIPTVSGDIPITFTAKGKEFGITATIRNNGDEQNGYSIYANNFVVKLDELENVNWIDDAQAIAFHGDTQLNSTEIEVTNKPTTVGKHTVTYTVSGQAATTDITVLVVNNIVDNEAIHAVNFAIDKDDALIESKLINAAHAVAYDISDLNDIQEIGVKADPNKLTQLGKQEIVFKTTTAKETPVTVEADVLMKGIEDGDFALYANNFVVKKSEAQNANIKTYAGVRLFEITDQPHKEITNLSGVSVTGNLNNMGKNLITFTHVASGQQIVVEGYVVDDIKNDIAFAGHNFQSKLSEADTDIKIVGKAGFKAFDVSDLSDIKDLTFTAVVTPIPTEAGDYTFNFAVSGENYTVDAIIRNNGDEVGAYSIFANNFAMNKSALTGADWVDLAGAQAFKDGVALPNTDIEVSGIPTTTGKHTLTFKVKNQAASTDVTVIVADTIENGEAIFATDFAISLADATAINSEANIISAASAEAYDISDLDAITPITPLVADPTSLPKVGPNQDVTIKTTNGTSTAVKAEVLKKGDDVNDVAIYANDFVVLKANADIDNVLTLAGVRLFDTSKTPHAEIKPIVPADITIAGNLNKMGANTITLTHKDGASVTVTGYVVDSIDDNVAFAGHNFESKLNEANTDTKVIGKADFKAFDISDLTQVQQIAEINVDVQPVPNKADDYEITFTVENYKAGLDGKSYKVDAVIRNNGGESTDGKYTIFANNFAMLKSELTAADWVALAGAEAFYEGTPLTADDIEVTGIPTTTGEFTLTYKVKGQDAETTVTVIVADKIENNMAIYAKDFTISLADAAITSNLVTFAGAQAFDLSDLNDIKEIVGVTPNPATLTEAKVHTVTYSATNGTDTITTTAKADVKTNGDQGTDRILYANNFVVKQSELTGKSVFELAGVQLFDTTETPHKEITSLTTVSADKQTNELKPGLNTITFTDTSGAVVSVDGFVVDKVDGNVAFKGHDFTSTLNDADSKDKVIGKAEFVAYDITNLHDIKTISNDKIKVLPVPTAAMNDAITFTVENYATDIDDKSHSVNAVIRNKGTEENGYSIYANNMAVSLAQLGSVQWVQDADVKAYNGDTLITDNSQITVTGIPTTTGKHTVTFGIVGQTATVDITVVVADTLNNGEAVIASDFTTEVNPLDDSARIVGLAKASAYDVSDLNDIKALNVVADPSILDEAGLIPVRIKTTTVHATYKDVTADVKSGGNTVNDTTIYANNFAIKKADINASIDLLDLAGVELWDETGGGHTQMPVADVTVTGDTTLEKMGPNQLVFTHTPSGATITAYAYVVDDIKGNIAFRGHDYVSTLADSNTRQLVIDRAEFAAYDLSNLPTIKNVTGNVDVDPIPNTEGDKTIKFTVSGEEYTVNAKIRNNGEVDGDYAIYANNIVMTKDQLAGADFVDLAGAFATFEGEVLADKVEIVEAPTTVGKHTVTFRVKDHHSTTIDVTVIVADVIKGDEAIFATDFAITLADASDTTNSAQNLVNGANAHAYKIDKLEDVDLPGSYLAVTPNPTSINAVGQKVVTYATGTSTNASTNATADVVTDGSEMNGFAIYANNFVVKKENANNDDILTLAGTRLFEKSVLPNVPNKEITDLSSITVDGDLNDMGLNVITLKHTSGAEVTINAYVVDEINGKIAFTGHDFSSTVNDSNTAAKVKANAGFTAIDFTDINNIVDLTDVATVSPAEIKEAREYKIEFTASGKRYTVDATIRNNGGESTDEKYTIYANNFVTTLDELDVVDFVEESKAVAFHNGVALPTTEIEVVNRPTTVGDHKVKLRVKTTDAVVEIRVIVADRTRGKEAIYATDFTIALDDAAITQNLIDYANAKAFDFTDLNDIQEVSVTPTPATITKPGETVVTYKTAKNTSTTATADVKTNGSEAGDYALYANNFVIQKSDVAGKDIYDLAGVELFDITTTPHSQETDLQDVDASGDITLNKMGENVITFTHIDGATVTVKAYVVDKIDGNIAFEGHDFSSTVNDSNTADKVKANAEFHAYDITDISNIVDLTTVATVSPAEIKAAGDYPVKFAAGGKQYPVTATIRNNGVVDGDFSIYANNFAITKDQLATADFIDLAQATAFENDVKLDKTAIEHSAKPTTVGTYTVTFKVIGEDASIDVTVIVADSIRNGEAIYASDFAIKLADAGVEQNIIDGANAKAFDITDLNDIQPVNVSATPNAITSVGITEVTFKTAKNTQTKAKADVTTNGDEANDFALYANNFVVLKENADNNDILSLAGTRLFDTSTTPNTEITDLTDVSVVSGNLDTMGENTIVIEHTQGATVTVKAYVVDKIDGNIAFEGHDFSSTVNDSNTADKVKANAEFHAYDITDISNIVDLTTVATVSPAEIKAAGDYPVKFAAGGKQYPVTATIRNNGVVDGDFSIYANNFAITKDQLATADFIDLAQATAFENDVKLDKTAIEHSAKPTTVGSHTVTFKVTGEDASIDVTVIVGDKIANNEVIYAEDFTIALADAGITQNLIDYSGAKAFDISDLNNIQTVAVTPNPTSLTVPGVQEVKYSTAKGTFTTANADVKTNGNESNNFTLYANNFIVEKDDLTGANLNSLAGVELFNSTNTPHIPVTDLSSVSADKVVGDLAIGENTITFTHTDGATVTIKAYVVNALEGDVAFVGHDFSSTVNDSDTKGKVIINSDFKAYDVSNISNIKVIDNVDVTVAPIPDASGDYTIEFTTKGEVFTVDAIIRNKGVVDGDYSIYANNFAITKDELTGANFIELADAKAFFEDTELAATDIEVLNKPTTVGNHTVTYKVVGQDASIDVNVIVGDVIKNNEVIYASDFTIALADVTKARFISYADAKAFDITDLNDIQPVSVDVTSELPTLAGTHTVTYATAKGTTTTANAEVKTNGNEVNNFVLYANNFVVEKDALTGKSIFDLAGVELFNTTNTPHTPITDLSSVTADKQVSDLVDGENTIVFTHTDGATVTVKGYVAHKVEGNIVFTGHNFNSTLNDANTDAKIIANAEFTAFDVSDLANIVDLTNTAVVDPVPTESGDYTITFTVAGETYTVDAIIRNNGVVDGEYAIYANNFVISVDALPGADFIALADAKAFYEGVELPSSEIEVLNKPTTVGTHTVTYKIKDETVSIDVTVVAANTIEPTETIYAVDFTIALDDVSEANFIKYANAKAYSIIDLNNITEVGVNVTTELPTTAGTHDVTFATANGTKTTVKAEVKTNGNEVNNFALYANNFVIEKADLANQTIFELAGVELFNTTNTPHTPITNLSSVTADKQASDLVSGENTIVFTHTDGATVSVKGYVSDKVEGNIAFTGHDFNSTVDDSNTDVKVIANADFTAFDVSDLANIVDLTNTAVVDPVPAASGDYTIKFTVSGEVYTVDAVIRNNGVVDGEYAIYANNFAINVKDLEDADWIALADARAFKDGVALPSSEIEVLNKPTTVGTHTVIYKIKDKTVSIDVTVVAGNTVEPTESIYAVDFTIALDDVSKANFITYANAKAYSIIDLNNITPIGVDVVAELPTTAGTHDVTFATANGTKTTVKAEVKTNGNEVNNFALYANNFVVEKDALTGKSIFDLAGVELFNTTNTPHTPITDLSSVTADKQVSDLVDGENTIVFTHTDGATVTVKGYVAHKVEGNIVFTGHNFNSTLNDANTDAKIIANAEFTAFDVSDLANIVDLTNTAVVEPVPTESGDYTITFTVAGETYTVDAIIRNNGVVDGEYAIYANNFVISVDALPGADFIALADAKAFYEGVELPSSEIEVLNKPTTVGTHTVTYKIKGETVSIDVTVIAANTVDPTESIYANDFTIALDDVSEANFIKYANAKAFATADLNNITEIAVNVTTELPTTAGTHDVTFATANGTKTTVKAEVKTNGNEVNNFALYANNFVIASKDVNSADFKALAGVELFNTATTPHTPIASLADVTVTGTLSNMGPNTITFKHKDGATVSVTGFVVDKLDPETKEAIIANDFALAITDVSHDNFIAAAKAKAYDVSDIGNIVEIPVQVTTELPYSVGQYEVTFATAQGTSLTVNATIRSKGTVNPGVDSIYANDFSIALKDLTVETVFEKSGVIAFNESVRPHTQLPNSAITLVEKLPTTTGSHELTFKLASGTEVKINVHVTATFVVEANDVVMTLADFNKAKGNGTLDQEILKRSNAKAIIVDTGEEVGPLNVDVSSLLALDIKDGNTYDVDVVFELDAEDITPVAAGRMLRAADSVQTVKTTIKIIIPKNPVKPVDPVDPVKPVKPTDPTDGNGGNGGGKLPGTGMPADVTAITAGLFAIASGLVLIIAKRRKDGEEDSETKETLEK